MLRITTDRQIDKINYELKEKEDEITLLKAENNELIQIVNGAYNRLDNYVVTTLCDYRQIIKQAKEILEPKTQKKLSDEIFEHFTSNS